MEILLILPGFIFSFLVTLLYEGKIRQLLKGPGNKVHFYVARDMDGDLWLYLRKPKRRRYSFISSDETCGTLMISECLFKNAGLNPNDFKNLKWEDEPVEVFLNLKD